MKSGKTVYIVAKSVAAVPRVFTSRDKAADRALFYVDHWVRHSNAGRVGKGHVGASDWADSIYSALEEGDADEAVMMWNDYVINLGKEDYAVVYRKAKVVG